MFDNLFGKKYTTPYSKLSVNTIRMLGVDAIAKAKSGHTGIVLGAAPIMYSLFRNHLNINPTDPHYFNRDRFVLSAGHGSALLYATMLICGYESISMEDLKQFRQINSKTSGHPENTILAGIEVSTGPLGQGVAMAVGMAIAEAKLANKFNKYNNFINHYTYCLHGDGCVQEGIFYESIAVAGKLKLNKLIMLYDSNKIQLDGKVSDSTNIDIKKLFKSCQWNYIYVKNANDVNAVSRAIEKAKKSSKPTIIECNSIIGFGSRLQNSNACHGAPLNEEQIKELRENINYKVPSFTIHNSVIEDMEIVIKRGKKNQIDFNLALETIESEDLALYNDFIAISENKYKFNLNWYNSMVEKEENATRNICGEVLQSVFENNSTIMSASADLSSSTKVYFNKSLSFTNKNKNGQNINFGVREFAMTAINNGIIAHRGTRSIGSTFMAFADYCKPAIRVAALSNFPLITIFSHDSITVGEDGPTHQPIEQLWLLRMIPEHYLFRPANLSEMLVSIGFAIRSEKHPVTIATSRGNFKQYTSKVEDAKHGGYVIKDCENHNLNLIATGSEVPLAIDVAEELKKNKIYARVISMPSLELFNDQSSAYQQKIFDGKPSISIEFGSTTPWYKYVDYAIGIDVFGKSGKPADVIDYLELTTNKVVSKINKWYKSYITNGDNARCQQEQ